MNIALFFDFFDAEMREPLQQGGTLGEQVQFALEASTDWQEAEVALIGVPEYRFEVASPSEPSALLYQVRKALYAFTPLSKPCQLIDLGNLRLGETPEETLYRLKEVCEMLISHHTFPLIVGGSHALDYGQYMAYENLEKIVSVLNVDARVDLSFDEESSANLRHVHQILMHHPNFLFEYTHLAQQRYLVHPETLKTLEKLKYDTLSVGQIRDSTAQVEPLIRAADMLSFDMSALKSPHGNEEATPFGLTGEEACQLCWYAGHNAQLSSAGFYGVSPATSRTLLACDTLAVMLWYFIEGFAHRTEEMSFKSNFHIKYTVAMGSQQSDLVFYKSKHSEKWWMEVPVPAKATQSINRSAIVPCSYEDYQEAARGNIPLRWIKTVEKFS